jgi:hypothetical protein
MSFLKFGLDEKGGGRALNWEGIKAFIIIIIIDHELGPDRPVSALSSSLFKGLPSRVRPFRL